MEEFFNRITTPCVIIAWIHVVTIVLTLIINLADRVSK